MYFVKSVSVATDKNKNFAGMYELSWYGKDCTCVFSIGTAAEATHTVKKLCLGYAKRYGYKRKCDAVRSFIYKNPENSEFWKTTVEIIEVKYEDEVA